MRGAERVAPAVVAGLVAAALWSLGIAAAQDAARLSAQEILERTAKAYAECASYRDTGVVRIVYLEGGGERTEERPFATAFVRPDRFRFEYDETSVLGARRRYIVWRLGNRVQTWWDVKPGVQAQGSLSLALAGATGVSGGSAHAIPALLLPGEVKGRRLTDMTDIRRVADANVGGADCYCIEGRYADMPRTVCVDRGTFLVRRIEFEESFPNFRTHETTTYEPSIDEPVPQELLAFDPPAQK